jgi:hypothetical protein
MTWIWVGIELSSEKITFWVHFESVIGDGLNLDWERNREVKDGTKKKMVPLI